MSDNFFANDGTYAPTIGSPFSPQQDYAVQSLSSLGQLATAIEYGLQLHQPCAPVTPPAILEEADFTAEQRLEMYLTTARRAQNLAVMENALALALRTQRSIIAATLSNTMPTALKIKTCEIPVLKLYLEFGLRSAEWRALVVRMLNDNVETGSGHLTVNRAKQVLKELAKRAGVRVLAAELSASTTERRLAAVILLGWLKHEKAISPMVEAFDTASLPEQELILKTLEEHYMPKLGYHLKWRREDDPPVAKPLLALLESA